MPPLPEDIRKLAQEVLTEKQYDVWVLEARGHGIRTIAGALDLAPTTVRDRLFLAHRNLRHAGVRMDLGTGALYLEPISALPPQTA